MSKNRKSGHFFEIFKSILSRDRGVCPGTFAPALVPGQRDTGARFFFSSRDKGTMGRPVSWEPYLKHTDSNNLSKIQNFKLENVKNQVQIDWDLITFLV